MKSPNPYEFSFSIGISTEEGSHVESIHFDGLLHLPTTTVVHTDEVFIKRSMIILADEISNVELLHGASLPKLLFLSSLTRVSFCAGGVARFYARGY